MDETPNVISVDWESGAEPPYAQAVANARVVALELEALLKLLTVKETLPLPPLLSLKVAFHSSNLAFVGKKLKFSGTALELTSLGMWALQCQA